MLQGIDDPIFRLSTLPQVRSSKEEQKGPALRSCQEELRGTTKGGKAFLQQSGYGVAWDCTPQSRAAYTQVATFRDLASFRFRIAETPTFRS